MAQMSPSDVFQPEIVVGLVEERLFDKTTLLDSGYIGDARKNVRTNVTGDKITVIRSVPVASNKNVQVNPRTGTPVEADKFKFESSDYDVVSRILAYDLDERAMNTLASVKDPDAHMAETVLKLASSHIQTSLINVGISGGEQFVDAIGSANWRGLRKAVTRIWGDKMDDLGKPLCILHPNVMYDLSCTEEAQKSGIFGTNGTIQNGIVYTGFAGMNFMQLSAVPNVDGVYQNLIITPEALQFYADEGMGYYEQRKAHTTTWQIDWDFSFCSFKPPAQPNGVIVYEVPSTMDDE